MLLLTTCLPLPAKGKKLKEARAVFREYPHGFQVLRCSLGEALVPTVAKQGFVPDSSDRAGGLMKLRYTRGDTRKFDMDKDIKAFTAHSGFPGAGIGQFGQGRAGSDPALVVYCRLVAACLACLSVRHSEGYVHAL
jgi:hypothetical protein